MKITTDVNYAGMRPAGGVSSRVQVSSSSNNTALNNQLTDVITAKLQRDRTMIDALTIAQSSRALVQKAMDISSRMRAIAFQAMTTGRVNTQELGTEIAGIQGTLQTYGEIITVPVSNSAGRDVPPPEFAKQVNSMSTAAEQLASGGKVNPEIFTEINSTLTSIAESADKRISNITSTLGLSEKNTAALNSGIHLSRVTETIVTNPEMSLTVQGNINPEVVKNLTAV